MSDKAVENPVVATSAEGEPICEPVSTATVDTTPGTGPHENSIPDDFLKVACCACKCLNADFPSCCGMKSAGTCLCIEGESLCCKVLKDDPKACCVCWSGDSLCISPSGQLCQVYEQLFCCELFCSFPFVETGYTNTPLTVHSLPDYDDTKLSGNVTVCSGTCCIIDSCKCDFPECLGCYRKGVCLCCEGEMVQCKPMCCGQEKVKENLLCILCKGSSLLVTPYTCCKGVAQLCCIDRRCACPCDEDVPCIWTPIIFCICCVQCNLQLDCYQTIDGLHYDS